MGQMTSAVTVARPIEEVFRHFLSLDENPSDPDVESVVKTPEGPTAAGTAFRFRHKGGRETMMRYTAVEPNQKIEFEGEVGPLRPKCVLTFEQAEGGTNLTIRGDSNPPGPLKLLSPVFNRVGQRIWDQRLGRTKAALEAEDSAPRE